MRGDIRDSDARREAFEGADAIVHLAAIVGDPACAKDPELSAEVNVEGSRSVVSDARELGVGRLVFASTCSNYGRMADPTVPIDEEGELAPVSLYAEQKVGIERALLDGDFGDLQPTCLRFATVYGAAPRMRFDLTVNEFTRDLWAERTLEVFGEKFWRPYVHVRDAARAHRARARHAGREGGREGLQRRPLRRELPQARPRGDHHGQLGRGDVSFVRRDEDPRDYKVSFEKVKEQLGFEPKMRVPDGIAEIIEALEREGFGDPFRPRFSNIERARQVRRLSEAGRWGLQRGDAPP